MMQDLSIGTNSFDLMSLTFESNLLLKILIIIF